MQENEFEKKLQQKLEMLQVQPAAEVWQKVKTEVAQKKKKRRFAFFFLLAFILSAGALVTTLLVNKPAVVKNVMASTAVDDNRRNANNDNTATNQAENADKKTVSTTETSKEEIYSTLQKNSINTTGENTVAVNALAVRKPITAKSKAKLGVKTTAPAVEEDESNIAASNLHEENNNSSARADAVLPVNDNISNTLTPLVEAKDTNSATVAAVEKKQPDVTAKQEPEQKVTVAKKEQKEKNGKWSIAFSMAGGVNYTGSSNQAKSLTQDYNGGTAGGGGGTPTAGGNYYSPSPLEHGTALAAGIHVYRELNSTVKLMMGLQYNYSTLSLKTGNRLDTAVRQLEIYRVGSTVSYTNRYHYITIPLSLSAKLFTAGSRDIVMEAGAGISHLVATNALSYNYTQGRYYSGVNDLNKTILSVSAFAAINLAGKNKPAFYIGPQINYAITPMAAAGLHEGRRAAFIGIKLQKNCWR